VSAARRLLMAPVRTGYGWHMPHRGPLLIALLAAALAAGCGGDETETPDQTTGSPPDVRAVLEVRAGQGAWDRSARAAAGEEFEVRLRVRNAGAEQAGGVRAALDVPDGARLAVATEEVVGPDETPHPRDPAAFQDGAGYAFGPLPGMGRTTFRFLMRSTEGASGDLRFAGVVTGPAGQVRDTATLRVAE
jgi:hypothetical protein